MKGLAEFQLMRSSSADGGSTKIYTVINCTIAITFCQGKIAENRLSHG
jgi:hypothetical protein